MSTPEEPQGVYIRMPSGQEIPTELAYEGVNQSDVHVWRAELPKGAKGVYIERLPARTTVRMVEKS